MPLDIEKFITAVEQRPALYNTRLKAYADKILKQKLWLEICEEFVENWTELGEREKDEKCLDLRKKWKNLRTCFKREYDAQKNGLTASGGRKRRKYLYFDQLLFLTDSVESRQTSTSFEENNLDESETEEIDAEPSLSPKVECIPRPSFESNVKKNTSSSCYEESLLQILKEKRDEEKEIDEDKYFLLSLLPAFKKFNEEQKYIARTEILSVMRSIRLSGSQNQGSPDSYEHF